MRIVRCVLAGMVLAEAGAIALPADVHKKIEELVVKTKYSEALSLADAQLKMSPNDAELHFDRALALQNLYRFSDAAAELDQALALKPGTFKYTVRKSFVLFCWGRLDDAKKVAHQAAKLDPKNGWPHSILGSCLRAQNHYEEALKEYDLALKDETTPRPAIGSEKVICLRALGRTSEAEQLQKQLPAVSDDFQVDAGRIFKLTSAGKLSEALTLLDQWKSKSPSSAVALQPGECFIYDLSVQRATSNHARLEKLRQEIEPRAISNPGLYKVLSKLERSLTNDEKALLDINKFIKARPDDYSGYFERATLRNDLNQNWREIVSDLDQALKRIDPSASPSAYSWIWSTKGHQFLRARMFKQAREAYDKAIASTDKTHLPELFLERAKVWAQSGDHSRAISDESKSLEIVVTKSALAQRAEDLFLAGQYERCIADCDRLAQKYPVSNSAQIIKVKSLLKLNRDKDALVLLNQLIEADAESIELYALRAEVYDRLKDSARARKDRLKAKALDLHP